MDWFPLVLSLKIAAIATLVASVLGVAVAAALTMRVFPGRDLVDVLVTAPLVLPPTVLGYYLLVLLGRQGPVGQWLQQQWGLNLIFTWQGAVIAASVVAFPLVFKPARAAFESIDDQLEMAAQVLGVSRIAIFWRVTLPLAWRGILAGILLGFARSLGEFGATLMVAGSIPGKTQTLSVAVYEAVQAGDDASAMKLVLVISVTCCVILLLATYLAPGRKPAHP